MRTSQIGIDLIHSFESFRKKAYKCPAGVWTIGWGSTRIYDRRVIEGDLITESVAELQFYKDLMMFEGTVKDLVFVDLNQNQFDALVSLCYNIGSKNFYRSSVLRYINKEMYDTAGHKFLLWNKAINPKTGKLRVLKGLVRRRNAERELYFSEFHFISNEWASMNLNPKGIMKLWFGWQNRRYTIRPFNMTTIDQILRKENI